MLLLARFLLERLLFFFLDEAFEERLLELFELLLSLTSACWVTSTSLRFESSSSAL